MDSGPEAVAARARSSLSTMNYETAISDRGLIAVLQQQAHNVYKYETPTLVRGLVDYSL